MSQVFDQSNSREPTALRPATAADIDGIMACERLPGYDDTVGRWTREEHAAGMADPTHLYVVALDAEGAVAGFVMLQDVAAGADAILVRRIAVREQGRGHGHALLTRALRLIFDELGAAKAWLRVWPHNARGLALYSKVGMREDGTSETVRTGKPASMTIMSIDAARYRDDKRRSQTP